MSSDVVTPNITVSFAATHSVEFEAWEADCAEARKRHAEEEDARKALIDAANAKLLASWMRQCAEVRAVVQMYTTKDSVGCDAAKAKLLATWMWQCAVMHAFVHTLERFACTMCTPPMPIDHSSQNSSAATARPPLPYQCYSS